MDLTNIEQKINCVFAETVYQNLLISKYGINSCKKSKNFYEVLDVYNLKSMLDIYINNPNQYQVSEMSTNLTGLKKDPNIKFVSGCECDISKLLEKINLL